MKNKRETELAMLEFVVQKKIQEAKKCLQEGKTEEMRQIIDHDILDLLQSYRESEMEKYNDTPDNLKESSNAERMLKNAEQFQFAIDLLRDKESNTLRPVDEITLNAVYNIVDDIIHP